MKVYVAIFNPQGSMGGFEWRATRAEVDKFVHEYESKVPHGRWEAAPGTDGEHFVSDILGIIEVEVSDEHTSNDDITSEIDAQLLELERKLGYDPLDYDGDDGDDGLQRDEVIVLPSGTEISIEAAIGDLHRAAGRLAYEGVDDDAGHASDLYAAAELIELLAGRLA